MTSYYVIDRTSAKFLILLRDFVPEYHHAKFSGNKEFRKNNCQAVWAV